MSVGRIRWRGKRHLDAREGTAQMASCVVTLRVLLTCGTRRWQHWGVDMLFEADRAARVPIYSPTGWRRGEPVHEEAAVG